MKIHYLKLKKTIVIICFFVSITLIKLYNFKFGIPINQDTKTYFDGNKTGEDYWITGTREMEALRNKIYYFKYETTVDKEVGVLTYKCKGIDNSFYYVVTEPSYESQNVSLELYYDTVWDFNYTDLFFIYENKLVFKHSLDRPRVLIQVEPPHYRLCSNNILCIKQFNWSVSYESNADINVGFSLPKYDSFVNLDFWNIAKIMNTKHQFVKEYYEKKENKTLREHQLAGVPLASWFCTNCEFENSNRESYVRELMNYIVIDSFGKCANNMPTTGNLYRKSIDPIGSKLTTISQYKFNIVFENGNCIDYITEKILHALFVGAVPIYMGHPYNRKYLPKGSYIYVGDFNSAKELADYLIYLDNNDKRYLKYHSWRNNPIIVEEWRKVNNFPHKPSGLVTTDYMCHILRKYQDWENGLIPISKTIPFAPKQKLCIPKDIFDYKNYSSSSKN